MYAFSEMLNLGLEEGKVFPSEDHRKVAERLCIGNPNVFTRDLMTEVVNVVIAIPQDRITTVTPKELIEEFDCPDIFS
jgi:hypothetical protein